MAARTAPTNVGITTWGKTALAIVNPVSKWTAAMTAAGVATTDVLERDSDGAIWDTTVSVYVPPETTNANPNQ